MLKQLSGKNRAKQSIEQHYLGTEYQLLVSCVQELQ